MPSRAITRSTCRSGSHAATITASNSRSRPVSYSRGISATAKGVAGSSVRYQSSIARRTTGWMMASRSRLARSSAKTMAPSAARFTCRSASSTPGPNRATTAASPGVPGAMASRASASASMVGTPRSSNRGAHVALARGDAAGQRHPHSLGGHRDRPVPRAGRDPLLDEGVPVVALRALPQQLGAAVAAGRADVGIEVEDGAARQVRVARRPAPALNSSAPSTRHTSWWMVSA